MKLVNWQYCKDLNDIDEAIKRAEEVASRKFDDCVHCIKCAEAHRQLAEWLKDYKRLLEQQPCEDCISRQAVLDQTYLWSKDEFLRVTNPFDYLRKKINSLSPVTPQSKTGHCKDCKWWKDSNGTYRRGVGAESQCPINRREVFEGNGYCYMFKPQESEE